MLSDVSPPTDSLYKFCALAGIGIIVVFTLLIINFEIGIEEKVAEDQVKSALVVAEEQWLESHLAEVSATAAGLEDRKKVFMEKAELTARAGEIGKLQRLSLSLLITTIVFDILGVVLAVYGFVNWYHKIQKKIDAGEIPNPET